MLNDLNLTIAALLKAELPADMANAVAISFVVPDETFPPMSVSLPAINFFLFQIYENTALRDREPVLTRNTDGSVLREPGPVRVDCHYLVTATAATQPAGGPEEDEYHLLGAVLRVLLRHRQLPAAALRGSLAGLTPPVRAATAQPGVHPSGVELWQALKGKPRASLHYTLTVPVDIGAPELAAAPVTALQVRGN